MHEQDEQEEITSLTYDHCIKISTGLSSCTQQTQAKLAFIW